MEGDEPWGVSDDADLFQQEQESFSIPDADYETCLKVLKSMQEHPDVFQKKKYKELRILITSMGDELKKRMFFGKNEAEFKAEQQKRREDQRKEFSRKDHDKKHINNTKIRKERIEALNKLMEAPVLALPAPESEPSENAIEPSSKESKDSNSNPELNYLRSCYICKARYYNIHFFYDNHCPSCAELAYTKRNQTADLRGRIAIVTGGRIKIGYQTALRLLRCGATVIVTSRFPHDAAIRFSKEEDFPKWKDNLHCYGLDMRDLSHVELFVDNFCANFPHLDILINNASQTVRKPPAFYKHLMPTELTPVNQLPSNVTNNLDFHYKSATTRQGPHTSMLQNGGEIHPTDQNLKILEETIKSTAPTVASPAHSAVMSQVPLVEGDETHDKQLFPPGKYDVHNQQLDLRRRNTWIMSLSEINTIELVEVTTINQLAPFIINSKLKPMFLKSPFKDKYVINVSAMEGKFYRWKTPHHPHTNMAKAALNMLTRTSAQDYAQDRIWMNSVDTGWVTDENPFEKAMNYAKNNNFICPLDEVEGMARVLDPVFVGINTGVNEYGKFFKDYHETEW